VIFLSIHTVYQLQVSRISTIQFATLKVNTSSEQTVSSVAEHASECSTGLERPLEFFHVGKAGGGSATMRLYDWDAPVHACHPYPCPRQLEIDQPILINIRDPMIDLCLHTTGARLFSAIRKETIALVNPDQPRAPRCDVNGSQ